jgi:hypothetical protein
LAYLRPAITAVYRRAEQLSFTSFKSIELSIWRIPMTKKIMKPFPSIVACLMLLAVGTSTKAVGQTDLVFARSHLRHRVPPHTGKRGCG